MAADRLLAEIGFPFRSGHATESTIAKLKHFEDMLFELQWVITIKDNGLTDLGQGPQTPGAAD